MVQFVIAGLVLGGIYAISAVGIVATYESAGVLNFAFGSMAFFIARMYYWLDTQHHWGIPASALVTVLLVGPAIGVVLWAVLFRALSRASTLVMVVAMVGLSVAIPPVATTIFGDQQPTIAPGLAPLPVHVFRVGGTPLTADQLIVLLCVVVIVVFGFLVLRFTNFGLMVRAQVDSETMTSLSGSNPQLISLVVWVFSMILAGLAGILIGPVIGLSQNGYTLLVAAAFAAVVAARLRSMPKAFGAALLLGVITGIAQYLIPPSSQLAKEIIPALPFMFVFGFVIAYSFWNPPESDRKGLAELAQAQLGNADGHRPSLGYLSPMGRLRSLGGEHGGGVAAVVIVGILPLVLHGFWVGYVGEGVAFAIVFLSYTLITGEGGVISLCQVSMAGIGGITAAQLATRHGWPVLLAVVAGGLVAVPVGAVLGLITMRLGDIYVALVTLTFGLLVENLIYPLNLFYNAGSGVALNRPDFAHSDRVYTYLMLGIFCLVALFLVNFRRSTSGLALAAVRWSEPGARTTGLSVVQLKILTFALAAFIAGLGGSLLAMYSGSAVTDNYATLLGLVWLSVVVLNGVSNNVAALAAGLSFALFPVIFQNYLPSSLNQVPTMLFGLGAVGVVRQPSGFVTENGRQIRSLLRRLGRLRAAPAPAQPVPPPVRELVR